MEKQREHAGRRTARLLMVLCAGALWGSVVTAKADDGTGFDPGDISDATCSKARAM
jgi:hypothetical protein